MIALIHEISLVFTGCFFYKENNTPQTHFEDIVINQYRELCCFLMNLPVCLRTAQTILKFIFSGTQFLQLCYTLMVPCYPRREQILDVRLKWAFIAP